MKLSVQFVGLFLSLVVVFTPLGQTVSLQKNLKTHTVEYVSEQEPIEEEFETEKPEFDPPESETEKHPCQRTCEEGKPRTCTYNFEVEYYYTMNNACYNCPYNATECNLKYCVAADGVKRTILVVNKQLPGPAIDVCLGDTVEVQLNNSMLDIITTIHWHGLLQRETPFMDGVPFVSQCPIAPESSFLYRFYADNPGTHLWHSHSALQRGDGIFGPLIVRVPPERDPHLDLYDFDLPEHVMTILDWNHIISSEKFMAHYLSTGDNKPPSILVNGKGRYEEFRDGDKVIYTPAEKFKVKSGHRYRFRVINAGFLNCPIEITIDNHKITVISSDAGNLQPIEAKTLVTVAGERFDFVLEANQKVGNYWMRFRGLLDCEVKKAFQVAILHYEGADEDQDPEGDVTYDGSVFPGLKLNAVNTAAGTEGALIMSEMPSLFEGQDPALKPEADVKFYLPFDFYLVEHARYSHHEPNANHKKSRTPQINHISMQFPNFPVMADPARTRTLELCNASTVSMECRFEFCECPHVLEVPLNAVVELILIDEGVPFDANHPFHLHGYAFRLIGMDRLGNKTTEEEVRELDEENELKRNLINPPIKDTITVPDGGYAIVRFHATNPGFWILHCHLDFHVEMGMALLFKVGEPTDFRSPPPDMPLCGDPFRPVPINETENHVARFFPTEGTKIYKENLVNMASPLRIPFVVFVYNAVLHFL